MFNGSVHSCLIYIEMVFDTVDIPFTYTISAIRACSMGVSSHPGYYARVVCILKIEPLQK